MRLLLVHNYYRQRGGEDTVFEAERTLLRQHGHDVETVEFHNASISASSPLEMARLARTTVWSSAAAARVRDAATRHASEVVHFHNTFPLVSPAAYSAARRTGAAVVQTLHNYRVACPNALFYRDGRPCEDCLGRVVAWPGVQHACYRVSRSQSAVVAAMQSVHRALGTWRDAVDCYIALTQFGRAKFIAAGLPEGRIVVKPNFIASKPVPQPRRRQGFLFVGRLEESKGILDLLTAWIPLEGISLRVVGDGPLRREVAAAAQRSSGLHYLGYVRPAEVASLMDTAEALVFPSRLYEGFPLVLLEAFAASTPVIASRLGAAAEIVDDGRTGLLFEAGQPADLRSKISIGSADPSRLASMGQAARAEYEAKYDESRNYELLMGAYGHALGRRGSELAAD